MSFQLSQAEADALIEMLKKLAEEGRLTFPQAPGKLVFDVVGDENTDLFAISIYRPELSDKCTYQGRQKDSNTILMRLDINRTAVHRNPDGEKVVGPHLHIYREGFEDRFAVSFDWKNPDLYETCLEFFNRFHILHDGWMTDQQKFGKGEDVLAST